MDSYDHLSGAYIKVSSPSSYVALVELARNPVNAFHEVFWTELGHVFDRISEEPTIRVVVLASALPKLFSAGIDSRLLNEVPPKPLIAHWPRNYPFSNASRKIKLDGPAQGEGIPKGMVNFVETVSALSGTLVADVTDPARRALQLQGHITSFQDSISALQRCRYPVIVATHGVAYGLSVDIMAACDVRYAASNTIFSIKEVDVGLAADIGTLARLPKITGNQSLASELALTARNFSAAEALTLGLVSRVVDGGRDEVVKAALETAALIAEKPPVAVLGTKRLLLHARDHTVAENLEYTAVWNSAMLQTQDIGNAVSATQKKQKPTFGPLSPKL